MLECNTKAEAAKAIDLKPDTVYRWGDEVDEVIDLMTLSAQETAVSMLTQALHKAVMVKLAGMDEKDAKIRQDAASEIIDRVLGKAMQRSEVSGPDGGAIEVRQKPDLSRLTDDELDALAGLQKRLDSD